MAVYVYTEGDSHEVKGVKCRMELVQASRLQNHLAAGWVVDPLDLVKEPEKEEVPEVAEEVEEKPKELSSQDVREEAKEKGLEGWDKKRINTLKKELGYEE